MRKRRHRNFRRHHLQSVARKLHVVDDLWQQRPGRMCERGAAEARRKFFRDSRSANLRAALHHQWLETGLRQIEGSHVVAAANNDYVASLSHGLAGPVFQDFQRR
jgi:hypothetical protein